MKKALSLILALVMCLSMCVSMCACGNQTPKSIELTIENIDQYIAIVVTYNNYFESPAYIVSGNYHCWCDINLQAYGTMPGTFSNVEITFLADVPNEVGEPGDYPWYPAGGEKGDPVQFTFRLPTTGEYSHSYQIECSGPSSDLSANCEFTIISVTGIFTPA